MAKERSGLDYVGFLIETIETIDRLGYLPVLIPHSYQSASRSAHNNDRDLCREVMAGLSTPSSCELIDEDLDPRALRCLIGRLRLLVASRFHSMISALATGVPPLTFGWGAHKYREVLEEFDVESLYVPYARLNEVTIEDLLRDALDQRQSLSEVITTRLEGVRAHCFDLPFEILRTLEACS